MSSVSYVWLLPVLSCFCIVKGLSRCTTPDRNNGDCKSILECHSLREMINKPGTTREDIALLKKSACGFENNVPKVCCPIEETPAVQSNNTCFTPEGSLGTCINVLDCKHIAELLQSPTVSQKDRTYVYSIRCASTTGFHVCCSLPNKTPNIQDIPEPTETCKPNASPPDPRTACCGMDGTTNKITEGTTAGIDQYPWLALIEYMKNGKIQLLCGGALISGRYVITAAHCVVETFVTPTNVRLGEYDTTNPGPDCVQAEGGDEGDLDCTEQAISIPIAQIIPHPHFQPRNPLRRDDIAMLRLAKMAPYTDFIRPICLPTTDVTVNMPADGKLFAAGWGAISDKILSSKVKLHVTLPYQSLQTCQRAYLAPNRRVKLWERQICAGGQDGKDTCKGDSGGPLMYSTGTSYELVGVVSFGSVLCGLDNIPGVYTKVFEYLPWIRSNIHN